MLVLATQVAAEDRMVGSWRVWDTVDPIDDSRRAGAAVLTDQGSIVVKCDEAGPDSLYVQFTAREYLGGAGVRSEMRNFTYRFDASPAVTERWRYTDNMALMLNHGSARSFASQLSQADRLTVRAIRYDYRSVDAAFDLDGAAEAIGEVVAACGDRPL